MIDRKYTYFAFISYKREDEKWAKWLQRKLEGYGFPVRLRKDNPDLPSKIRPVFRDQSELSGGNLKEEIEKGLEGSKYLVVICSPRAAQSPWVSKEVQYFIDHGKEDSIIPFIIGGTPNAANPEDECFPDGLRKLTGEKEILGININEMGREAAAIKVIARMFGLRFDTLWQRHQRLKRRRNFLLIVAIVLSCLVSLSMIYLRKEAEEQREIAHLNQNKAEEEKDRVLAIMAKQMIPEDSYGACIIALELLRKNINNTEAEAVLREASQINNIVLRGHTRWVNSISFSYDSLYLASSSDDRTVKIWDLNDGRCIKTFKYNNEVIKIKYTSDKSKLISVTKEGNIYIYDLINKKFIKETGSNREVSNVSISGNGEIIGLLDNDKEVVVYDETLTAPIMTIKPQNEYSDIGMLVSKDGKYLYYTTPYPSLLNRIELKTRVKKTINLEDYGEYLQLLSISDEDSRISIKYEDKIVVLDKDLCHLASVMDNTVANFNHSNINNEKVVISGHTNGLIKLWNTDPYTIRDIIPATGDEILEVIFHPSKRYLAYFGFGIQGTINIFDSNRLYNKSRYSPIFAFNNESYINSIDVFINKGLPIVTLASEEGLNFLRLDSLKNIKNELDTISKFDHTKILFSPSGKYLVADDGNRDILVWDTQSKKLINSFTASEKAISSFSFPFAEQDNLAIKTDNSIILINLPNYLLKKNPDSLSSDKLIFDISPLKSEFLSELQIDNQYNIYTIDSKEKKIIRYNLSKHTSCEIPISNPSKYFSNICLSPDKNYIAITDNNLQISIFDINSNKMISRWDAHKSLIREIKWHPSGKYLITSAVDATTKVWNPFNGICVLSLPYYLKNVNFTKDGQSIYGLFNNRTFLVFPFPSMGSLIAYTKSRFKYRILSRTEKQIYHLE